MCVRGLGGSFCFYYLIKISVRLNVIIINI